MVYELIIIKLFTFLMVEKNQKIILRCESYRNSDSSVHKVLLEHSHGYLIKYYLLWFCITTAELKRPANTKYRLSSSLWTMCQPIWIKLLGDSTPLIYFLFMSRTEVTIYT